MRWRGLRNFSLATQLTVWYALVALLLLSSLAFVQYQILANDLAGEDDQLLIETLAAASRGAIPVEAISSSASLLGPHVRVLDVKCSILVGRSEMDRPPVICPGPPGTAPILRTWTSRSGRLWRSASVRLPEPAGGGHLPPTAVWAEAALDRWIDSQVLESYREKLIALVFAAILLSSGIGFLIARRGLAMLGSISVALSDVKAESLKHNFEIPNQQEKSAPEIEQLLISLNEMRERLNDRFAVLENFSAELAHEFRTPIHILRQKAEIALIQPRTDSEYREVLSSSLDEYDRLNRMVGDTLFLARVEDPSAHIALDQLSVETEVSEVLGFFEALAAEREVRLTLEAEQGTRIDADRTLLRRALVNVLANAIHHTPTGGSVTVGVASDERYVSITTTDTGTGIAQSDLNRVFDRYFRGQTNVDPEGSGLGLSIVKGIMTLHHGQALIESSTANGTVVTLRFPRVMAN